MFDVKVKTLDGKNTSFTVEDEITVAEFKEKICSSVNIPAASQRLIFTGKVLANDSLLKSHNVADKVIHVVNSRPPPASSSGGGAAASNAAAPSTSSQAAHGGPTVSMSSVPSNMLGEMMGNVMAGFPPGDAMVQHVDVRRGPAVPPQHTESGRRVVLIRQWIRDAHTLLDRIMHPPQGTRLSADTQTAEARGASQMLHSVPGTSVSVSTAGPRPPGPRPPAPPGPRASTQRSSQATPVRPAVNQTPRPTAARATSTSAASDTATPTSTVPPVNPSVEVLSSLWGEVDALNSRLHVHTHRFRDLLNNPTSGCPGHNQHLFDIMSSVTHSYGHIYHALSDLHCDFGPESNRELTAAEAPAPPPTAIIQQTIPVTIPLRATVNVAPNASRRPTTSNVTNTTSTAAADASRPAAQPNTSAASDQPQPGVYTSIELDMETDSGEDITEDGPRSESRPSNAPIPPMGHFGGFNLSQFLQDTFAGIPGMGAAPGAATTAGAATSTSAAVSSSTAAASSTAAVTPASSAAASVPPGAFGSFIPPAGAATAANGPAGHHVHQGLPPGFPFPHGAPPVVKDRQDPYLSNCSSKHWLPPRTVTQSSSQTSNPRTPARTSTASSRTASQHATAASTTAASTSQRQSTAGRTRTNNSLPGGNPASRSNSNSSMASSSAATSLPSHRSPAAVDEGRRRFLEEIRDNLVNVSVEQSWLSSGQTRVPVPSLQRLNERMRDMFNSAVQGRAHIATLAELYRISVESLPSADSGSPQLGLLGELCTVLSTEVSLLDMYHAYMGHGQHFDRLRGPLRRFARSNVLQDGSPSDENLSAAVGRLILSIGSQLEDSLREVSPGARYQYDVVKSICSYVRSWLRDMLGFLINSKEGVENYGQQLLDRLHQGLRNLLRLSYSVCDSNADLRESARLTQRLLTSVIEQCTSGNRVLGTALKLFIVSQLSTGRFIESIDNIALSNLEEHMVRDTPSMRHSRDESPMVTDSLRRRSPSSGDSDYHDSLEQGEVPPVARPPADDSLRTNIPTQTTPTVSPSPLDTSSLSEASAADWRAVIPADWVAIIEEDIKRQLRLETNSVEQPLSDAYLNGRPQKRRRLSEDEEQN